MPIWMTFKRCGLLASIRLSFGSTSSANLSAVGLSRSASLQILQVSFLRQSGHSVPGISLLYDFPGILAHSPPSRCILYQWLQNRGDLLWFMLDKETSIARHHEILCPIDLAGHDR